jgi:hypothetical protein
VKYYWNTDVIRAGLWSCAASGSIKVQIAGVQVQVQVSSWKIR